MRLTFNNEHVSSGGCKHLGGAKTCRSTNDRDVNASGRPHEHYSAAHNIDTAIR